jgi:PAS domain S-box-containing protein
VTDFEGRFRSVNPAWTRLWAGRRRSCCRGRFSTSSIPDDHATVIEEVGRILGGASMQGFTDRLLAKDGRVLWVEWAGVPENGLFYAVGRDITRERSGRRSCGRRRRWTRWASSPAGSRTTSTTSSRRCRGASP